MENNSDGFQRANFGNWTMTVQEATNVFNASGIPRSDRTVKRYCKNETLKCKKFDFDRVTRWMIDPDSVTVAISEFKEMEERKQEIEGQRSTNDVSGYDMPHHVTPGQDRPSEEGRAHIDNAAVNELKDRVKTL